MPANLTTFAHFSVSAAMPDADRTMILGPNYAKPMELGWQALALSLIQSEIDDDDRGTKIRTALNVPP
jgi:hypothetical protein